MKITFKSKFIKPEDLVKGETFYIYSDVTESQGKFGLERNVDLKVASTDEVKRARFNNVSLKEIVKAYGDETASWLGKALKGEVVKQLVSGELKNVLIFTPDTSKKPVEVVDNGSIDRTDFDAL